MSKATANGHLTNGTTHYTLAENIPKTQKVLLLHSPKQSYQLTDNYPVPLPLNDREVLIRSLTIALNPIDWKAADFNFGLPELPYIAGRELVGEIVQLPKSPSRFQVGDRVVVVSTDYRDLRKAAYQEYVIASDFNLIKLPRNLSVDEGATLGVAFVAAVVALGVCLGFDFTDVEDGPDLLRIVREADPESIPQDIRKECLEGINTLDRAKKGDWVAVWGGSATLANLTVQLSRLAGLRVVTIVDKAKHGLRLSTHDVLRPDLLIDSYDPDRAVDIIHANFKGQLRLGIDTRGQETAGHLLRALSSDETTANGSYESNGASGAVKHRRHLVGLTGLPKVTPPGTVVFHTVPIKLFHEIAAVGETLTMWLEKLLERNLIVPPEILDVEHGFEGINTGLDRMRKGEISGGKLVVRIR